MTLSDTSETLVPGVLYFHSCYRSSDCLLLITPCSRLLFLSSVSLFSFLLLLPTPASSPCELTCHSRTLLSHEVLLPPAAPFSTRCSLLTHHRPGDNTPSIPRSRHHVDPIRSPLLSHPSSELSRLDCQSSWTLPPSWRSSTLKMDNSSSK